MAFPGSSTGKEPTWNAGDPDLIPGSGSPLEKGMVYCSVDGSENSSLWTSNLKLHLSLRKRAKHVFLEYQRKLWYCRKN